MNFEFFSTFASETVSAQWGGAKGNSVGRGKMLRIRNSARCCDSRPTKPARYWHIRVYVTKTTDRKRLSQPKGWEGVTKRDKSEDLPLRTSHKRCYAICTREYRANQTNGKEGLFFTHEAVFDLKDTLVGAEGIGEIFLCSRPRQKC